MGKMEDLRDAALVRQHYYRALECGSSGKFTVEELRALRQRQQGRCAYCNYEFELVIEHVIPLTRGGLNIISNICLACRYCNNSKADRLLEEWTARWYFKASTPPALTQTSSAFINHLPYLLAERFEAKIDLDRLSKDVGLSYAATKRWAKGRVKSIELSELDAWCAYLNVEPGDLFTRIKEN